MKSYVQKHMPELLIKQNKSLKYLSEKSTIPSNPGNERQLSADQLDTVLSIIWYHPSGILSALLELLCHTYRTGIGAGTGPGNKEKASGYWMQEIILFD